MPEKDYPPRFPGARRVPGAETRLKANAPENWQTLMKQAGGSASVAYEKLIWNYAVDRIQPSRYRR
jgi:hypothetical protein